MSSRWFRPTVTLPVAVGAVFFVAGVVQVANNWPVIGDWAVAELIVRHLGRHLPLSGPYSATRGYDHPLPWVYAIEWLPYRIAGSRSSAAPAMALWWNGAWASFVVWILARRKANGLAVIALAALLIMASSIEGVVLLLPWNPNLAVVPAFALLFVSWRVAIGERRFLPLSVGLGIWCAGANLAFLPFAAALVLVSSTSLTISTLIGSGLGALRTLLRPVLLALAVAVVLAAPMIVDVVAHGSQSNPARIVQQAGPGSSSTSVPASQAVKVLRAELAIPPAWTRVAEPYDVYLYRPAARVPVLLALVPFVMFAAWRRRARDELFGIAISLAGLGAATIGLVHVDDTMLQPRYLLPAHIAGAGLVSFVLWSTGRSVRAFARTGRAPVKSASLRRLRAGGLIALPCLCLLGTTLAVSGMHTPPYFQSVASTTENLAGSIEHHFPKGAHLIVDGPLRVDGYYSQSLTLQLDRAGYDVRVPDEDLYMYTAALAVPKRWVGTTLTLQISGPAPAPPTPGATLVGRVVVPPNLAFAGETLSIWQRVRT
ncbi:MAG TPA: hypothetical protein VIK61_08155 [Acidimicrobiia bacterium]